MTSTGVFKAILDADGEGKGNPKLKDVDVVDDFPNPRRYQNLWCEEDDADATAVTIPKIADIDYHRTQLVLCPSFFK